MEGIFQFVTIFVAALAGVITLREGLKLLVGLLECENFRDVWVFLKQ